MYLGWVLKPKVQKHKNIFYFCFFMCGGKKIKNEFNVFIFCRSKQGSSVGSPGVDILPFLILVAFFDCILS